MRNAFVMLLAGLAGLTTAQAAPTQWTSGAGANGHYYEFIGGAFTWDEALADAQSRSYLGMTGYLVTALNASENMFVSSDIAGGALAWIGASDNGSEGNWTWRSGPENGQALTFFSWNAGEPNNCCNGENYVHTNWGGVGLWNDHGGPGNPGQRNGYVVEFNDVGRVPEPVSLALVAGGLFAAGASRRSRR